MPTLVSIIRWLKTPNIGSSDVDLLTLLKQLEKDALCPSTSKTYNKKSIIKIKMLWLFWRDHFFCLSFFGLLVAISKRKKCKKSFFFTYNEIYALFDICSILLYLGKQMYFLSESNPWLLLVLFELWFLPDPGFLTVSAYLWRLTGFTEETKV